jgi:hypothetical protein
MSHALNCEFIVNGLFDSLCQRAFAQTKEQSYNGHHKLLPMFGVKPRIPESKMISAFLEIPNEMRLHVTVFWNFSLPITLVKKEIVFRNVRAKSVRIRPLDILMGDPQR